MRRVLWAWRPDPDEDLAARLRRIGMIAVAATPQSEVEVMAVPRAGGTPVRIAAPSRCTVSDHAVATTYAQNGFGAALSIGTGVAARLATGALADVDARYSFGHVGVRALTRDPYPTAATLALRDFLRRAAGPGATADLALSGSRH